MRSHTELKGIYAGGDVYVLGSGSSMGFIDRSFFGGKIVIGANSVWKFFPVSYAVFKHRQFIEEAINASQIVVVSKHDCGDTTQGLNTFEGHAYVFTHKRGRFDDREKHLRENLGPGPRLVYGDIRALPYEDGKFDVIGESFDLLEEGILLEEGDGKILVKMLLKRRAKSPGKERP